MEVELPQNSRDTTEPSTSTVSVPALTFESLTFSDGTTISLDPRDVVVFVGPNNAGKSAALKELQQHIGSSIEGTVIKKSTYKRSGSVEDIILYFNENSNKRGTGGDIHYQGHKYNVDKKNISTYWAKNIGALRGFFCQIITTERRLLDSNPADSGSFLDQPPSHPIHLMYLDDQIENRISGYFRRAFAEDLIVYQKGGSQIPLIVGERLKLCSGEDRISASYIKRLNASTVPLQNQGDGMRSFATVILHLLAPSTPSVLLLDEPEAYLHPPQARLLGEIIAKERTERAQLFVATHSSDVLQGLLNVAPEHLRVLRIQRDGSVNRVKELDKSRAKEISTDPLMKYSAVLSGIFHQRVIISEADADCMFYSALLDLPTVHGEQQPDVLFVHTNGKHRMAALAEALAALDVRIDVIADMDVLKEEPVLQRIVQALGGDWPAVKSMAGPLKKAIEERKPWLNASEVKKGIQAVLEDVPATGEFPRDMRTDINAIFRKASPWDAIKDAGEAAIPAGQPTQNYQALKDLCKIAGLWIVPVGELEGFCKSVGGHGPRWVQEVIEKYDLLSSPELEQAREFVGEIWSFQRPAVAQHDETA